MTHWIIEIYDSLKGHTGPMYLVLLLLTGTLLFLLTRQTYSEDITDFLPLDSQEAKAMNDLQEELETDRIFIILQSAPSSVCVDSIDTPAPDCANATETLSLATDLLETLIEEKDTAGILEDIFCLVGSEGALARYQDPSLPSLPRWGGGGALLTMTSPYGGSETEDNSGLITMLRQQADSVRRAFPDVKVIMTGGPVIAVGNAQQIKQDSTLASLLALILIGALLLYALRDVRGILLIVVATAWGWLFAMGTLTLMLDSVSLIVIGISSVILGIAVNYPLHLTAHLRHTLDIRQALREITTPLLVGNITTVGAFLALMPLHARALRDLGFFSALLLMGTIFFVLLFMPHMTGKNTQYPISHASSGKQGRKRTLLESMAETRLENKRWLTWTVVLLTVGFAILSSGTHFDTDIRHLNYMTEEASEGMAILETMRPDDTTSPLPNWGGDGGAASIARHLSDDFNYIGWACSAIVFCFLWATMGSIELALLSFLPMAVSWVWILGLMAVFDIQFNMVNVILATFIFGQGDDYTIFMTEGCVYEYAYRRKMLASYRSSIILSALIMFIGIGTLITAKHPALHSLAEVTIVGMFTVVLTAYIFPPLIFRWLVKDGHGWRKRPLTLRGLFARPDDKDAIGWAKDLYRYRGVEIYRQAKRRLRMLAEKKNEIEAIPKGTAIVVMNNGWGECALAVALMQPESEVFAFSDTDEEALVAANCAREAAPRLHVCQGDGRAVTETLKNSHRPFCLLNISKTIIITS